jgi:hypothetical protein
MVACWVVSLEILSVDGSVHYTAVDSAHCLDESTAMRSVEYLVDVTVGLRALG